MVAAQHYLDCIRSAACLWGGSEQACTWCRSEWIFMTITWTWCDELFGCVQYVIGGCGDFDWRWGVYTYGRPQHHHFVTIIITTSQARVVSRWNQLNTMNKRRAKLKWPTACKQSIVFPRMHSLNDRRRPKKRGRKKQKKRSTIPSRQPYPNTLSDLFQESRPMVQEVCPIAWLNDSLKV